MGEGGDFHEGQEAYAGADRQEAAGGGSAVCAEGSRLSMRSAGTWRCRCRPISVGAAQFKAMRPEDVVRLKQLEKENARLKRMNWWSRRSISTCCGRCPGETSDPGAAAQGGRGTCKRQFPRYSERRACQSGEAASLVAALLSAGEVPDELPAAGAAAAARQASSPLRLSAYPRAALPRGLGCVTASGCNACGATRGLGWATEGRI